MIKINGLEKKLSDDFVLKIDSLTVNDGEKVALIGPNGSGKSTLLKLLAGEIKPDKGSIEFSFDKKSTGYAPQEPYVFKGTAEYNIKAGAKTKGTEEIIKKCGLENLAKKKTSEMSGGERQRTCLARILAGDWRCLLLDEPLSAVDIDTCSALETVLNDYCGSNGTTLFISTHVPSQALKVSTKILLMNNGKIEEYTDIKKFRSPTSDFGKKFISLWSL